MARSVRLSNKHGLNPTIPVCFFCGQPKNEVALLGSSYKEQAPLHMICNYEPCEQCQSHMKAGVVLVEVTEHRGPGKPNQPPIQNNLIPTGSWWVITHEAAKEIFNKPIIDKAFISIECANQLGLHNHNKT